MTVLGIIIGVAAVITMVTLGDGTTQAVKDNISNLGSNLVMVRPGSGFGPRSSAAGVPNFTEADVTAIAEQVPGVAAIAPVRNSSLSTIYRQEARSTSVTGSTLDYFEINSWELAEGRYFTTSEAKTGAAVAVIGNTVKTELFDDEDPIGQKIRVGQASLQIIGILKAKGQAGMGDQDDTMVVPLTTMQRRLGGRSSGRDISQISISAEDDFDSDLLISNITSLMRQRRNLQSNQDNDFNVFDTRQIAETLSSSTQLMTTLLAAVAVVRAAQYYKCRASNSIPPSARSAIPRAKLSSPPASILYSNTWRCIVAKSSAAAFSTNTSLTKPIIACLISWTSTSLICVKSSVQTSSRPAAATATTSNEIPLPIHPLAHPSLAWAHPLHRDRSLLPDCLSISVV
tara:strand:- start:17511 stop:18710 length:1200 start_codon:yes stop_codon:yes gene_type:complete